MKIKITLFTLIMCCASFLSAQTNVAFNPKKTVTASSNDNAKGAIVDGNLALGWQSDNLDNQWVIIDLQEVRNVSEVKVYWEAAKASLFHVEGSLNGTDWTNVATGNNPMGLDPNVVNTFSDLSSDARYIRINCITRSSVYGFFIYEVEIKDNGPKAFVSSFNGGDVPSKINDADPATRWASLQNTGEDRTTPGWVYLDLGREYEISRVNILWEGAFAKNYRIETSNNATDWDIVQTITNNAVLSNDLTGLSASGRYVRIYCTEAATQWGYSIWELEVYGTIPTLPVDLIGFTTQLNINGSVSLNWSTSSENDNNYFLIEKSVDGINFTELKKIYSKNSNSNSRLDYQFTDNNPANGINYYRLSQYDNNGKSELLSIKEQRVSFSKLSGLYPNPLQGSSFNLVLNDSSNSMISLSVSALSGKEIFRDEIKTSSEIVSVKLPFIPAKGIYIVKAGTQSYKLIVE